MTWYKGLENLELIFIGLFLLFYLSYIFRQRFFASFFKSGISRLTFKIVLRSLYFTLIIIALLGPSFGQKSKEVKIVGKDIFIAMDLSKSMDARDVTPSRLEKAKFEIQRVLDRFNSDRIGLIIFSSEAFVQCPLTFDQSALRLFFETINTDLVPEAGTDVSEPLELASKKLLSQDDDQGKKQAKIIILISDGEDFGDRTKKVASQLDENGIKLFTLGIGTRKGERIPAGNGFLLDENGQEARTMLNDRSLKELAVITGGNYYEISDQLNEVGKLINSIENIEGTLRGVKQVDAASNKYLFFLLPALALILLDSLITTKVFSV